ncbi:hypothetical protein GOBAR_AA38538 [Gossypium barbadense]|uniref:Uncharacterized protein n=1 Tax=Gossypium barbadense TaxID=3634 RepID=A0A2P5VTL6_GOSBA|nr:hypothetical protein GOBAR_AA38538 [Gossypium barbadense]
MARNCALSQMPNAMKFLKELLANKRKLDEESHVELNAEKKPNLEEMLSKFISVSETHFQNTKTALKNQEALIQGLETQIGQLSKLISEQPQGSLPSNTEPNPREQLNAINEISLKEVHEPLSNNSRGSIHEERRLQIEELDEWRTYKLRTHDKPKLHQNELDTSPNQLKVGDKVLLDAADPHIVTTTSMRKSLLRYSVFFHSMYPQGISSMLSMRMIERRRGTYPPQYRLTQSTEEEPYEDIPDDVPPQHEDPPTQPPPPSCPVHAAASYANISERLTRFEQ